MTSFRTSDTVVHVSEFLGQYGIFISVVIIPMVAKAIVPRSWDRRTDEFLDGHRWILWMALGLIYLVLIPVLWYRAARL